MADHILCGLAFTIRWALRIIGVALALICFGAVGVVVYANGWPSAALLKFIGSALLLLIIIVAAAIWAEDYKCRAPKPQSGSNDV